jgi:hypothetical protein
LSCFHSLSCFCKVFMKGSVRARACVGKRGTVLCRLCNLQSLRPSCI